MSLKYEFLATLTIEVAESYVLGETPAGWRRIANFAGGSFVGPRISGTILPGSADAVLRRRDNAIQPDVRLTLRTDDKAHVWVTYRGIRHGPQDIMDKIARDEPVDPGDYYQRAALYFETGAARYDWLNRIIGIGTGRRVPGQMIYDVYELL
ncbi:MAG: DUF3237 domain-containing protein [Proteobacteria bacterium]|nr:DUF3237 domain-containing protein [Pseudomonadota bacterium]